ncbi:MAG: Dam family site-specific DNA-(adenine-N6)-methyltransferase [Ignavibacteriae bacterium]|nr:Dam family site-specific DNA-(adenine-N6)-methyltransferase [Ignavibacteriota bacterium]
MNHKQQIRPFLRWVGGKAKFINTLLNFVPPKDQYDKYFEPFLGAGSLFFSLNPKKAVLSDVNSHLINCYLYIREQPELVHKYLSSLAKKTSKSFYYIQRDEYNKSLPSAKQAARFLYLNKTSYNGIFRVNKIGKFNVPYGYIAYPVLPSLNDLRNISVSLYRKNIIAQDYSQIYKQVKENDFIYLDPPYPPLNGTSFFTHYTIDRFSYRDQEKLNEFANKLSLKNCYIMISNADTPKIRELYYNWNIFELEKTRFVSCKTERKKVKELIITNYFPG